MDEKRLVNKQPALNHEPAGIFGYKSQAQKNRALPGFLYPF
jgi:hypothetical protein